MYVLRVCCQAFIFVGYAPQFIATQRYLLDPKRFRAGPHILSHAKWGGGDVQVTD
jgi:hypothetical protein